MLKWLSLSVVDTSINLNDACTKRRGPTGQWFLESSKFANWSVLPQSFLWLHGKVGSGKTVLSSTIIQAVIEKHRASGGTRKVAYFYFDYGDQRKQKHQMMLRSLVAQLYAQSPGIPDVLDLVFNKCLHGLHQPSIDQLFQLMRGLVDKSDDTFILIDALDEFEELDELLEDIETMTRWNLDNLHILVTSRDDYQIRQSILPIAGDAIVSLGNSVVDSDISIYISE